MIIAGVIIVDSRLVNTTLSHESTITSASTFYRSNRSSYSLGPSYFTFASALCRIQHNIGMEFWKQGTILVEYVM